MARRVMALGSSPCTIAREAIWGSTVGSLFWGGSDFREAETVGSTRVAVGWRDLGVAVSGAASSRWRSGFFPAGTLTPSEGGCPERHSGPEKRAPWHVHHGYHSISANKL